MKKTLRHGFTVVLATVAMVGFGQQVKRELAHLPPPVRQAIRAQLAGGRVEDIEKDTEDGEAIYDVEIIHGQKERSYTFSENGDILSMEVFLDEVSVPVQNAIKRQTGSAVLDGIDKSTDDGETTYDVDIVQNGVSRSFTISSAGEVMVVQMFLKELPPSVQQTIAKQAHGAALGEIDRCKDDGEITYEVETAAPGNPRQFTVGEKGDLIDMEVSKDELPPAVQSALQKNVGPGGIDQILKCFDEGETNYEVDTTNNRTLVFDSEGELFSTEEPVALTDTPEAIQNDIKSRVGDEKVLGITKLTDDGDITYEVETSANGVEKTITIGK